MARLHLGVELGVSRVRLVAVSTSLRATQVVTQQSYELSGVRSLDAALDLLEQAVREHKLRGAITHIALDSSLVSYRLLDVPFADARRAAPVVRFELDGKFAEATEDLEIDFVVTRGPMGGGRAMVCAVSKARAAQIAGRARALGLVVRGLTSASVLLDRALDLPEWTEDSELSDAAPVAMFVEPNGDALALSVFSDDGCVAVRSVRLPPLRTDAAVGPRRTAWARELVSTRLWLEQRGYALQHVLVTGGEDAIWLLESPPEIEGLTFGTAEAVEVGRLPPVLLAHAPAACLCALGGRQLKGAPSLYTPVVEAKVAGQQAASGAWVSSLPALMVGMLVALGGYAVDTVATVKNAEAELAARNAELAAVTKRVFGRELTAKQVKEQLGKTEGDDLTELVPVASALDVLRLIADASRPVDAEEEDTSSSATSRKKGAALPGTGAAKLLPPRGRDLDEAASEAGEDAGDGRAQTVASRGAVDASGIVTDDELLFTMIDIREGKVVMRVTATRSSAQDRLALRLQTLQCFKNPQKGKVRDRDQVKEFELTMDQDCYLPAHSSDDTVEGGA